MDINRKTRLARAYALCEWPCLIGVVCAIMLLLWQSAFTSPTHASIDLPSLYGHQRSLQDVDSNCRQVQYQPAAKDDCTTDCARENLSTASALEEPDFGWSILTCSEADRYHNQPIADGSLKNLVIEVIKTNRAF